MISAFASAIASTELQVRRSDVGPDAHLGLRNFDERTNLSGVIHPQLNHRNVRLVPQLQQGKRQANVIVQISPVAKDPVSDGQELR